MSGITASVLGQTRGFFKCANIKDHDSEVTIKDGSRRAEESCMVLMMMKAAKLGWSGPGAGLEQGRSWAEAGQEQSKSRAEA